MAAKAIVVVVVVDVNDGRLGTNDYDDKRRSERGIMACKIYCGTTSTTRLMSSIIIY